MRKYNMKLKRKGRKQMHSKTRGLSHNKDESGMTIPESSIKNVRIKSAIENGSRISLPSDTKGLNLSKFEHIGKEGPLVVYAEDKKMFNEFGHFNVITSFKPYDSLRNQLFFASQPVSKSSQRLTERAEIKGTSKHRKQIKKDVTREATTTLVNSRLLVQKNNSDKVRQTRRQPNSFEELVMRYKDRQEKYRTLLGDDSLYLFQKIDHMCKTGQKEKDTSIAPQEVACRDTNNTNSEADIKTQEKILFPKITAHQPRDKKVHIRVPQQLVVSKDKREQNLPSLVSDLRYSKL
jgi:hypothetical protein